MTHDDLLSATADKAKAKKEDVDAVVSALVQTIRHALSHGEEVRIPGLGAFKMIRRAK